MRKKRREKFIIHVLAVILIFLVVTFIKNLLLYEPEEISISIENVAAFTIPAQTFSDLKTMSSSRDLDFAEVLTVYSLHKNFFPPGSVAATKEYLEGSFFTNYRNIKRNFTQDQINIYKHILSALLNEIECFPVDDNEYYFSDTFGAARTYGGSRTHEGTDIMDVKNVRGRIPIISMTGGTIRNIGWGELGGYNIGINTPSGNYFYYAHFDSFAEGLSPGDIVEAGQIIGFMGDSGYGTYGTRGMFPVHLHIGIKVRSEIAEDGMFWINPYVFLRNVEGLLN